MTPQRESKRVKRALRTIPVDAVAPAITGDEASGLGLWCLVAGEVSFVPVSGRTTTTLWENELTYAQYHRWLKAHPERIHATHEAAVAFVQIALRATA